MNDQNNLNETQVNNELNNQDLKENNVVSAEELEKELKEEKRKNTRRTLLYFLMIVIIFIIILLLLKGCNALRNRNRNKIMEANDWVTNMWNKCIDPVYWYVVDGTGVNGASIEIDAVLNDCETYYAEYQTRKSEITGLSNEYSDFKEIYAKVSEQIEIIYPKIKANKPVAKESVDYEDNMDALHEHQVQLYNLVKEKYSEEK